MVCEAVLTDTSWRHRPWLDLVRLLTVECSPLVHSQMIKSRASMDQLQQRRLTQIKYCSRHLAAESEGRDQLLSILTEAGYSVKVMDDGLWEPATVDLLWIQGDGFFLRICRKISYARDGRGTVAGRESERAPAVVFDT